MGFYLYTGNNLEKLTEEILCRKVLSKPLTDPFKKEKIIVQSRGMASWLKQQIAENLQICANMDFPFLNRFISEILEISLSGKQKPAFEHFSPDILTFKIYSILETQAENFPELSAYLEDSNHDLKRLQLAEKIAETFDQYLIYRPEMMLNWEKAIVLNTDNSWQAKMWQILSSEHTSPVKGFQNFFQLDNIPNIPYERIILFGISYMPLLFLDFFKKLGESSNTEVYFFYLNPCSENWYYNLTDKQIDKYLTKSSSLKNLNEEELYIDEGNKLLISYGQAGREFFGAVLNATEGNFDELFIDIEENNLLNAVQRNILFNENVFSHSKNIEENDFSIKIHNCHSRTREIETLFDNLLNYIEKTPEIQPRDIFVMAPDISIYAPTIKSVFDQKNNELNPDRKTLPYSLSDINIAMTSKIIKAFFDILNLNYSKFKITEILDILETKAIHKAFDIEDSELDIIRKWIIESGIRWGIDSAHREELGLPSFYENSISFAFDRMFLGFALENRDCIFSDKIVPYDEIEISDSLLLGKFSCFINALIEVKTLISCSDTIENWIRKLHLITDKFFSDNNDSFSEILKIRKLIDSLAKINEMLNLQNKIGFDVIKYYLSQKTGNEKLFEGFLRGKITFCTMQPMRTVPAKIICLLGMNEGAFPRDERKVGFNILDKNIRICDKSKTLEDRYIFLESLLAAKNAFYISFIGSDNKTNEVSQPSIAVTELCDYIKSNYSEIAINRITVNESLHAFNEKYLNSSDISFFTYSKSNFSAAETLRKKPEQILFFQNKLKNINFNHENIVLHDIIDFFKNPCRFFITKSLGAKYIKNDSDLVKDVEPIETDGLERYELNKMILAANLENKPLEKLYEKMSKECSLPIGNFGKIKFKEQVFFIQNILYKEIKDFNNQKMLELINDTERYNFEIKINKITISCEIDFVKPLSHMVFFDPGQYNGKKIIDCWIKHLALNSSFECTTYCYINTKHHLLKPMQSKEAKEKLSLIVNIFKEGFLAPIPFFPNTSFKYASEAANKLEKAQNEFTGNDYNKGECDDFYIKQCFDVSLFTGETCEEFKKLSAAAFAYFWNDEKDNETNASEDEE